MRYAYRLILIAFLAGVPIAASAAQQAFTIRDTEVFAGPSGQFPPVAVIRANVGVGNMVGQLLEHGLYSQDPQRATGLSLLLLGQERRNNSSLRRTSGLSHKEQGPRSSRSSLRSPI